MGLDSYNSWKIHASKTKKGKAARKTHGLRDWTRIMDETYTHQKLKKGKQQEKPTDYGTGLV